MYREFMTATIAGMINGSTEMSSRELVRRVSINSKATKPGDLFFALKGEHTDGHYFISEAQKNGAVAVVVEEDKGIGEQIIVADTLFALGELAKKYRSMFEPKTIAVTGTNGKTTVKNLIGAILRMRYNTLFTKKNYNSLIGLPLTLLDLTGDEDYLVVEMGTSNPGEIQRLCDIARPDIGVITTIGPGHLEGLGSIEGVKKEKLSLIKALPNDGIGVIGEGIDHSQANVINFNIEMLSDVQLTEYGSNFIFDEHVFFTPLLGMGNVMNCLAALCVCTKLGINYDIQRAALEKIKPEAGRLEPLYHDRILLINDTYNANPVSMKMAVDFAAALPRRKIFILGDMLELGKSSTDLHNDIGDYVRDQCDLLLSFGEKSRNYRGKHFTDKLDLVRYLIGNLHGEEVILIKASRSLHFEQIVQDILRLLR
ncbi:MAG: UDP-N-acetylmuramoyl-tripeptide--D-alanyl-D-alanine ligase [bacterium]